MSQGFSYKKWVCKIGKREDKKDCAKKKCDECRHWILTPVYINCMVCRFKNCDGCLYKKEAEEQEANNAGND